MRGQTGSNQFLLPRSDGLNSEQVIVVEANIDDMNPEIYGTVFEKLFEAGAVDVFLTPIIMKKGRPANILTALTTETSLDKIVETYFKETTSIGLRINYGEKRFLPREKVEIETPWGPVLGKVGKLNGEIINLALEYEDCRRLSSEAGIPVKAVYQTAGKLIKNNKND